MPTIAGQLRSSGARSPDRWLIAIVSGVAIMLAGVLGWLGWSAHIADEARAEALRSEAHSFGVIAATGAVLGAARDAETGQRGYLLTLNPVFLQPFRSAQSELPLALRSLEALSDTPARRARFRRLEGIANERMRQLIRSIEMAQSRDYSRADADRYVRSGKSTMDELRSVVAQIENEERRMLDIRRQIADRATVRAEHWRLGLTLFSVLLFAVLATASFFLVSAQRAARRQRLLSRSNFKIEEGRKLLRLLIDCSPGAIFVKDRTGRIIFCNRKFEEIVGKSLNEMRGQPAMPVADPQEKARLEAADQTVMQSGQPTTIDEHITVNGETRTFTTEKIPWLRDGRVVGVISIARDVTDDRNREAYLEARIAERTEELSQALDTLRREVAEREAAEQAAQQMQRIESLGKLTGGIAHDFNNMLTIIMGALAVAKKRIPAGADPQLQKSILNAEEGAARAAELTRGLLALARKQPLNPKPVNVNLVLQRATTLLKRTLSSAVKLEMQLCPDAGWVLVDEVQLVNALVNLAVNARDAMPEGGNLTLSTGLSDGHAIIEVADDGDGMTAEVRERVFEPFFTTKDVGKGTGLGLSQVHGFVTQSGGTIEIDSTEGEGTVVRLVLNRCEPPVERPSQPASAHKPCLAGKKILLVEDEPLIRLCTHDMLSSLGYQVVVADGARSALAALENDRDIALMLTDVVMPEMDGRQLAYEAIRQNPGLKIILATGNGAIAGDDAPWPALPKPYSADDLSEIIAKTLSGG